MQLAKRYVIYWLKTVLCMKYDNEILVTLHEYMYELILICWQLYYQQGNTPGKNSLCAQILKIKIMKVFWAIIEDLHAHAS